MTPKKYRCHRIRTESKSTERSTSLCATHRIQFRSGFLFFNYSAKSINAGRFSASPAKPISENLTLSFSPLNSYFFNLIGVEDVKS